MATVTAPKPDVAPLAAAPVAPAGDRRPSRNEVFGFFLMVVGMFMAILDIQIVSASLSQIQAGLAASADEISWVQTSYLVAEVIMLPLSGFLARALSTKWLFVLSSLGFTAASFLCSTADSINQMILYRALQGFLGGAMIPSVYVAMFAIFGRRRQASVQVAMSLIITMAPTIGPAVGGWLSELMSWHWLFLINIIPGLIITVGVWGLIDIDKPDLKLLKRIDLIGLATMAVFLGGLDFVLEEGARRDWFQDETLFIVAVAAAVSAMLFAWRSWTAREPIVNLHAFTNMNFLFGTSLGAVMGIGLYGLIYLYPLYLSRVAGLSSGQIGQTLFVTGLSMGLSSPFMGFFTRRSDPRKMLCVGFLIFAFSTWMTTGLTAEWRFDEFFLPQVIRGVGLMACMVSISITAFATLPPERLKDSTGLFTLMRNLGGAIGLAGINTVVLWRFNLHWGRLAEAVNPSRPEIADRMDLFRGLALSRGMADPDAFAAKAMANSVYQQALVMSYADCFVVLTWLFVGVALIPLFLKRPATLSDALPASDH
jgi:MFS transporter, DHA2 family, multidrug resistance protein